MLTETLTALFERDLKKLKKELKSYKKEENIWLIEKGVTNSTGNLCLHLIGNLNWFIGGQLGETGYIRQRELEFSAQNVPLSKLLKGIDAVRTMVEKVLGKVNLESLNEDYPLEVFKSKMTTEYFLVHLSGHLAYHLGQINFHRRLLDENCE